MHSSHQYAIKKLQKELEDINNNPEQFDAGFAEEDIFLWNLMIYGPEDTMYEGGLFQCSMKFPKDYPSSPPEMTFNTPMWHPNIHQDGKVCISILHPREHDEMNEQEQLNEKWSPVLGVKEIVISVISMLISPNIDSPANVDAAVQYKSDFDGWKKKVRRMTQDALQNM